MTLRDKLKARQQELEFLHKRSMGQNFLVSENVVQKIVKAVSEFGPKSLIEIGPGLGSLTDELEAVCTDLVLLEMDHRLVQFWKEKKKNIIEVDALRWTWDLSDFRRPTVLVSNLPYQISSSILIDRSVDSLPLDGMVLMFQKEVAQRIQATQKSEVYGFLSVMAQTFWSIDLVLEAGPRDFDPAPRVASRVLSFNPRQVMIKDRRAYLKLMKSAFLAPRKYMLSNLCQGLGHPKEKIQSVLEAQGVSVQTRADQLKVQDFIELFYRFHEQSLI